MHRPYSSPYTFSRSLLNTRDGVSVTFHLIVYAVEITVFTLRLGRRIYIVHIHISFLTITLSPFEATNRWQCIRQRHISYLKIKFISTLAAGDSWTIRSTYYVIVYIYPLCLLAITVRFSLHHKRALHSNMSHVNQFFFFFKFIHCPLSPLQ